MTKNDIKKHLTKAVTFGEKEFKKLHKKGKVEITNQHYYDIIGKELTSYYDDIGTYGNYSQKKVYRTNYKTTNRKFSPSLHLLREFKETKAFIDLKMLLPNSEDFDLEKFLDNFHRYFFRLMVRAEHKYNPEFKSQMATHFYDVITNLSFKTVDMYLFNGIWTKTEVKFQYSGMVISISKPSLNDWLLLSSQHQISFGFNSFLEITRYSKKGGNSAGSFIENAILQLLSLYRLSSPNFSYRHIFLYFDEYVEKGYSSKSNHDRTRYTFELRKSESKRLNSFCELYMDKLLEIIKTQKTDSKKQKNRLQLILGIKIALDRFKDTILAQTNDDEKRVSTVVMGLEALYNYEDHETIGFKLKIRTAKTLASFGFDADEVAKNISRGYSIRSKYAHGSLSAKEIEFDFIKTLINYLRVSILIFLHLDMNKDKFIEIMNKSFYSKPYDKELTGIFKEIKSKAILIME